MLMENIKQITYLILWVVTGVLFAIMLGGIIELVSLWLYGKLNLAVVLYGIMSVIGVFIGLILGPIAWRKIYVEGPLAKK